MIFFKKKAKEVAGLEVPPPPEEEIEIKAVPKKEIKVKPEKIKEIKVRIPEAKSIEEEIVEKERKTFEALKEHREVRPVFVKIETYSEAMEDLMLSRTMAKEVSEAAKRLIETRELQNKEYENWQRLLLDVQKKLIFADKILFR